MSDQALATLESALVATERRQDRSSRRVVARLLGGESLTSPSVATELDALRRALDDTAILLRLREALERFDAATPIDRTEPATSATLVRDAERTIGETVRSITAVLTSGIAYYDAEVDRDLGRARMALEHAQGRLLLLARRLGGGL